MKQSIRIIRIPVFEFGKLFAVGGVIVGFIQGAIVATTELSLWLPNARFVSLPKLLGFLVLPVVFAAGCGVIAFLFAALAAFVYNHLPQRIGQLQLDCELSGGTSVAHGSSASPTE